MGLANSISSEIVASRVRPSPRFSPAWQVLETDRCAFTGRQKSRIAPAHDLLHARSSTVLDIPCRRPPTKQPASARAAVVAWNERESRRPASLLAGLNVPGHATAPYAWTHRLNFQTLEPYSILWTLQDIITTAIWTSPSVAIARSKKSQSTFVIQTRPLQLCLVV